MRKRSPEERYQTLIESNFYKILRDRELSLPASFLLIYLRGLSSYYGKPNFFWKDSKILSDLSCLSKKRLYHSRHELKIKGLIEYTINHSRYIDTSYLMLDTMVADIKTAQSNPFYSGAKIAPVECQNRTTARQNRTTLTYKENKDKERRRMTDLELKKTHEQTLELINRIGR